jgi:hypothetical protein
MLLQTIVAAEKIPAGEAFAGFGHVEPEPGADVTFQAAGRLPPAAVEK